MVQQDTQRLSVNTYHKSHLTPRTAPSEFVTTPVDPASLYDRSKLRAVIESPRPQSVSVNATVAWASLLSPGRRSLSAPNTPSVVDSEQQHSEPTTPQPVHVINPQLIGEKPKHITRFYSHSELRAPGPYPSDVHLRYRELYLSESEFVRVLRVQKSEWDGIPQWKQTAKKKESGLF
eukprot:gene28-38_t